MKWRKQKQLKKTCAIDIITTIKSFYESMNKS